MIVEKLIEIAKLEKEIERLESHNLTQEEKNMAQKIIQSINIESITEKIIKKAREIIEN